MICILCSWEVSMSRKDTIAFSFESWLEKGTWQNIFRW